MLDEADVPLLKVVVNAGSYQSLSWGVSAIGGIMSAYFSGSLIQDYGVPFVFGLTAVFPLMTLGAALLIQEQRVTKTEVCPHTGSEIFFVLRASCSCICCSYKVRVVFGSSWVFQLDGKTR